MYATAVEAAKLNHNHEGVHRAQIGLTITRDFPRQLNYPLKGNLTREMSDIWLLFRRNK